jgi:hypothetical protein
VERLADYTPANRQVIPTPYPTDYTSQLTTLGTRMDNVETMSVGSSALVKKVAQLDLAGAVQYSDASQPQVTTSRMAYVVDSWLPQITIQTNGMYLIIANARIALLDNALDNWSENMLYTHVHVHGYTRLKWPFYMEVDECKA